MTLTRTLTRLRRVSSALLLGAGLATSAQFAHASPAAAQLLAHGQADQALALLNRTLAANQTDAEALNLECRVYFSEGQQKAAQAPCERAVALAPESSSYHLWLGRVLGRQAQHAPMLSAYSLAKRVRTEFETANRLGPRNAEAAADLAEFYVTAPKILGGGSDKALKLADSTEPWSPALAHGIRAEAAEKHKDDATAERELLAATQSPDAKPETWVALASYYRKKGQVPQMLAAIDKAVALDTAKDDALVSAADQLTRSGQRPEQSIALLRAYLGSNNQSENAPAFAVHAKLAELLAGAGDNGGAQTESATAHSLASGWQPRQSGDHGKG